MYIYIVMASLTCNVYNRNKGHFAYLSAIEAIDHDIEYHVGYLLPIG